MLCNPGWRKASAALLVYYPYWVELVKPANMFEPYGIRDRANMERELKVLPLRGKWGTWLLDVTNISALRAVFKVTNRVDLAKNYGVVFQDSCSLYVLTGIASTRQMGVWMVEVTNI